MNRIMRLVAVIVFITALPHMASSQSLSINTDGSTAHASAMLDVKSLTKGLLIPRMSRTERDAIAAPATGLIIFQNAPDSIGFYYYNGSSWSWLLSNSNTDSLAWKTGGNGGTVPGTNFIGTTDNKDLVIKTNNAEAMHIGANGFIGIGLPAPTTYLDITGTFGGTNSLQLRSGNSNVGFASNQVLFGYNGTTNYRHAIKTRHNSGGRTQNAIDFFLWNQVVDAAGDIGTKQVMTIDGEWRGMVGIGTTTPKSELHITDGSASLKTVNDGGGFGASMLITDNNLPRIYFEAAAEPANKKMMDIRLSGQSLRIGSLNDAGGTFDKQNILVVNRDGNVGIGVAVPVVSLDVAGSATIGTGNTNTGGKSIVSGTSNILSGSFSMATGEANTLTASRSIVAGLVNVVGGFNNIVVGYQNSIDGPLYDNSIVVGYLDTLTASASAVFGYLNKVTAYTGFAAGDRNLVSGVRGTAFGYESVAAGIGSFVTGSQDTARGDNSSVFGIGNHGASYSEMALGTYGTLYTPVSAVTFNVADRIFNIGNGVAGNLRSDALTILKNGNLGIGTANPTAFLDVNSNTIRLRTAKTPASSTAAGNTGDIAWDNDYIYVCVATNTWKKVLISTW